VVVGPRLKIAGNRDGFTNTECLWALAMQYVLEGNGHRAGSGSRRRRPDVIYLAAGGPGMLGMIGGRPEAPGD
jgi:hypothetical protein